METQDPKKEALKALIKEYKLNKSKSTTKKPNVLENYVKEIHELRFKQKASFKDIWELLDKAGIKTSRISIAKICTKRPSGKSVAKEKLNIA